MIRSCRSIHSCIRWILTLVFFAGTVWLPACGGGDDASEEDAGSGGFAGDSGGIKTGGTGAASGKGGHAGNKDAGSDTGAGGQAGTGGDAGTAGDAGAGGQAGTGGDAGASGDAGGPVSPPEISTLEKQTIEEDKKLVLPIGVKPDGLDTRVWVEGMPPGAQFNEVQRTITFTPDFIQGGNSWKVTIHASNESGQATKDFDIEVLDTIAPPLPTVEKTVSGSGYKKLSVVQKTDDYLDSKGYAGRTFSARVYIPDEASATNRMPVRIQLHGFGGAPYDGTSSGGQYRIYPSDSQNTYWWGYGDGLPEGQSTKVPNYTQRRVLHLLEWVLRTYPGADPERVYLVGGSMGGAGAATLGLLYARHFAFIESNIGQMIPRNHRSSRLTQLEGLWGTTKANLQDATLLENGKSMGVWDRQDLCRVMRDMPEARDQFILTKHGKDDPTIHFGAVTHKSPITLQSYYETVQKEGIGHYAVWDEGGHGTTDPVMGAAWWDDEFSFLFDSQTVLRRDQPFPAFTRASHDWNPGDGKSNGKQQWNDTSGFAGKVATAGDTGWSGDIAGALNRFLRWDTNGVIDTHDRFEIPLFVKDGKGQKAPKAGYPSIGDLFDRKLPVKVDVTLRRVRGFQCRAGEPIRWEFDGKSAKVTANDDGSVTVPQLALDKQPKTLVLTRDEP